MMKKLTDHAAHENVHVDEDGGGGASFGYDHVP